VNTYIVGKSVANRPDIFQVTKPQWANQPQAISQLTLLGKIQGGVFGARCGMLPPNGGHKCAICSDQGAVFFIIAGISFLLAAGKYWLPGNDSAAFPGALVVNALVMLTIGIAVRRKNVE
jgi:hypothetical protein